MNELNDVYYDGKPRNKSWTRDLSLDQHNLKNFKLGMQRIARQLTVVVPLVMVWILAATGNAQKAYAHIVDILPTVSYNAFSEPVRLGRIERSDEGLIQKLDRYDPIIEKAISYFSSVHNVAPPKNLVKAKIAVESLSPSTLDAFEYDPMQVANKGDFALVVLQNGAEGKVIEGENTNLIGNFSFLKGKKQTPRVNGRWDYSKSNMDAESSIFAGTGWLVHKAAIYGRKKVDGQELFKYSIRKGDTYSGIARRLETNVKSLIECNPDVDPKKLKIGQEVYYRKSSGKMAIVGWRTWKEAVERYNGGGDDNYWDKIVHNWRILNERDEALFANRKLDE